MIYGRVVPIFMAKYLTAKDGAVSLFIAANIPIMFGLKHRSKAAVVTIARFCESNEYSA